MARLKGGPLEHVKEYRASRDRLLRALDVSKRAATCRRFYDALTRAAQAYGEEEEHYWALPNSEQERAAVDTDQDGDRIWRAWSDFVQRCAR